MKIIGDIGDAVRYAKGYEEAKKLLVEQKGWSLEQFEAVDWKNLDRTLKTKADAHVTWLSKNTQDFVA